MIATILLFDTAVDNLSVIIIKFLIFSKCCNGL